MTIGPQLPASVLEKRKREEEDEAEGDSRSNSSSDSDSKRQRTIGPTLPSGPINAPSTAESAQRSDRQDSASSSDDDDDDDDDFGPALPSKTETSQPKSNSSTNGQARTLAAPPAPPPAQRDEWMTMAPASGDWSSRVDPTKLKARGFNTSKTRTNTSAGAGGDQSWHETPEQKQMRLQRELMGITDNRSKTKSSSGPAPEQDPDTQATAQRMKEYNATRGPSLLEARAKKNKEEDDDPSARAFDYEKDMAGGSQINATQRRDMMKKASDFGSRFSSAKYL